MSKVMWIINQGVPVVVVDCYLLRDEYTTAEGAPLASPRTCEPGPGTLVLDQTDGQFSINATDDFVWPVQGTPAWGDQEFHGLLAGGIATVRKLGRILKWRWQVTTDGEVWAGWNDDITPTTRAAAEHSIYHSAAGAGIRALSQGSDDQALRDLAPAVTEWWPNAIILGGYETTGLHWYPNSLDPDQYRYGAHFFSRDESGDDSWRLIWYRDIGDDDALYPAFSNYDSAGLMDYMRIPCDSGEVGDVWTAQWPTCLTPIAYDEFTDNNGVLLPAHTMTYGGLTWVNAVGVWDINANQADPDNTAIAHAYVPTTKPDVWVEEQAGFVVFQYLGFVIRKSADTSGGDNLWRCQTRSGIAGNDTYITERNDGASTIRAQADIDPTTATHNIRVRADDEEITLYIDYVETVHYGSAWFNRHATWHGMYANASDGARFDNFIILPRGTGLTRIYYDSFTGANGTNLPAHAMDEGGLTWVQTAGADFEIQTNEAREANAIADSDCYAVTTVSDIWNCARVLLPTNSHYEGLVFRKSADTGGGDNKWTFVAAPGVAGVDTYIYEYDNGVQTARASSDQDYTAGTRYYLEVEADGQTINGYEDGNLAVTHGTASFNETAVWHGIHEQTGNNTVRWDQARVTEIPAGEYDAAIDIF